MKICFVTNATSKKDDLTTYDIATAASSRGHDVYFMNVVDFHSNGEKIYGNVHTIPRKTSERSALVAALQKEEQTQIDLRKIGAMFLRHKYKRGSKTTENYHKMAREYAFHLQEEGVFVLNNPVYLPFWSSKIATLRLDSSILPEHQLVSTNFDKLFEYCKDTLKYEGVLKPAFGAGGEGVYFLERKNLRNTLKSLLENGPVIAQNYIKNEGDKRILVLGGQPIAWYLRVAGEGELLNNIHAGGKPEKCDLSERDKKILDIVKPQLVKFGMHFVGIDTLGGYLSEINSDNPGGTIRADAMGGFDSKGKVVDYIESKVKK